MGGWAYTVQSLNVISKTMLGERVIREYVGSLNPSLLVRENLTEAALDRWVYALLLQWELWVPMFNVKTWQYESRGDERDGGFAIRFKGEHLPDAHLGNYALESNRMIRAQIAANAIKIIGL
jgi:hypothetical protein